MGRGALASSLVVWLTLPVLAARADSPSLKEALALQEAMQAAIQEAEPAIACILVSRSEIYRKLGQTPPADGSGKLGRFTARGQDESRFDMRIPGYVPESYGSGVVIDESGLILTTEHLIRDATKVFVRLPGGIHSYADIHAADPRSDLAVLRLIDSPAARLRGIKVGDGGKVRKGQWVLSLANPFAAGFRDGSPSASWGIISNLRRRPASEVSERDQSRTLGQHGILLQTDARLHLGCSGGALLDLRGELIGLTTSVAAITGSETAGGFAVPLDAGIRRIVEVLKRGEEVEYGFLGVNPGQPRPGGGLSISIFRAPPHLPAKQAGLQEGDAILSVNGTPIHDADDLFLAIGTALAGSTVRLEVVRAEHIRTTNVTLAKFYVPGTIIASKKPPAVRGVRVDYLSVLQVPLGGQLIDIAHGVVVREVQNGSSAAAAFLKVNDIVTHVKGQPVHTPADFYKKVQAAGGGPIELTIGNTQQIELK